jgi:hypothetical protein
LTERLVYEAIKQKIGSEIPYGDYNSFIRLYENKLRLDGLRQSRASQPEQ